MPIGSHWSQAETVDASPELSPDDVEAQQFESVQRGYDPAAVVNFLRDVARSYRQALAEAASARRELELHECATVVEAVEIVREVPVEVIREVPVPVERAAADPYESMSDEVATVLRAAYESAAEVRAAAERETGEQLADLRRRTEEQERALAEERNRVDIEIRARRQRFEKEAAEILAAAQGEAGRINEEIQERLQVLRNQEQELADRLSSAGSMLTQLLGDVRDVAATVESSTV